MKVILNPETVNKFVEHHNKLKIPFQMVITRYTTRIISKAYDLHFLKSEQSNKMFMAFNMLKKEVKQKKIKPINNKTLNYFSSNLFKNDFYADRIYNIDIKAAYATVLLNDGFITQRTYDYIMTLPKIDRLAAVGMLAGKKNIFNINAEGKIISDETIISETSDYFFYCVEKTSELMFEAEQLIGSEAFLFSWVDGIYFLDNESEANNIAARVTDFFNNKGFRVSFDILEEFHVINKNDFYKCSYKKEGKNKYMNVPKPEQAIFKKITEHLISKCYKDENNKLEKRIEMIKEYTNRQNKKQ